MMARAKSSASDQGEGNRLIQAESGERQYREKREVRTQSKTNEGSIVQSLEEQCATRGMRMTDQRRTIARIMENAHDHPDVEELHRRAANQDPGISLSTVYRTLNLFEEAGLVTRHDFKDGRARFESIPDTHHDHLIDIRSGRVIEFRNEEIEAIQELIARRLGYRLVDHRLELYAVPLKVTIAEKSGSMTSREGGE